VGFGIYLRRSAPPTNEKELSWTVNKIYIQYFRGLLEKEKWSRVE
jgi:hypothetical protein